MRGAHFVGANASILQLLMICHHERFLILKKVVNVLLSVGQEELIASLLEGRENIDEALLLVLAADIKVLLVLEEDVEVPVRLEDWMGGQAGQKHLMLCHSFLRKIFTLFIK